MNVLRYENSLAGLTERAEPTVFLAGPTVRGNQLHLTSWRPDAIDEFSRQGFNGTLVLPEFTDRRESDKGKLWIPRWEFAGLTGVDVILFWIPRTRELIGLTTNFELGYWLARHPEKCVYGRPDESYRNTYNDLMMDVDAGQRGVTPPPVFRTLQSTVTEAIRLAAESAGKHRVRSRVAVDSPYGAF